MLSSFADAAAAIAIASGRGTRWMVCMSHRPFTSRTLGAVPSEGTDWGGGEAAVEDEEARAWKLFAGGPLWGPPRCCDRDDLDDDRALLMILPR